MPGFLTSASARIWENIPFLRQNRLVTKPTSQDGVDVLLAPHAQGDQTHGVEPGGDDGELSGAASQNLGQMEQATPESDPVGALTSDEDEARIPRFVDEIVELGNDGSESFSCLRDGVDGQLAINEVWKRLFRSSTPHDDERRREVLKYVLLKLILKFNVLPVGPVFTSPVQSFVDSNLQAGDHREDVASMSAPKDREKQERARGFIIDAFRRDPGSDSVLPLPEDVDGQVVIDECWDMLTSKGYSEIQKADLRRLGLKLILGLDKIPAELISRGVHFSETNRLGSGAFADVYRGKYRGNPVAVKRVKIFERMTEKQKQDSLKALHREAFLWKLLKHPSILPFLGVSADDTHQLETVTLVSQLAEHGRILDYILPRRSQEQPSIPGPELEKSLYRWLYQISSGIAYLHDQGIIHGDLHCGNILINAGGDVQLTDFGLSLIAEATSYNYGSIHGGGAVFTCPPELLNPELDTTRPTKACDVYAFAFVLLELLSGERAFPGVPDRQIMALVLGGGRPSRLSILEGNPTRDMVWSLIVACWDTDPHLRPPIGPISRMIGNIVDSANREDSMLSPQENCRFDISGDATFRVSALFHDYFVCSMEDGSIEVYSVSTQQLVRTLRGHTEAINCMLGIKQMLLTASQDQTIRIWDLRSGKCVYIFRLDQPCRNLAVSNPEMVDLEESGSSTTGNPLIVYSGAKYLVVLTLPPLLHTAGVPNVEPQKLIAKENPYFKHCIDLEQDSVWNAQGNFVAIAFPTHMEVWDVSAGKIMWKTPEQPKSFRTVSLDVPRGIVVTTLGADGVVWDLHTGERQRPSPNLGVDRELVMPPVHIPGSYTISYTNRHLFSFTAWDPATASEDVKILPCPIADNDTLLPFAHNNTHMAYVDDSANIIRVAEIKSGSIVATFPTGDGGLADLFLTERLLAVRTITPQRRGVSSRVVIWELGDLAI